MSSLHQLKPHGSAHKKGSDLLRCRACEREQRPLRFCIYCGEPFVAVRPVAVLPVAQPPAVVAASATGPELPQPGVTPPPWSPALLGRARAVTDARLTWVAVDPATDEEEFASMLPGSVAGNHQWPTLVEQGEPVRREPVVLLIRMEPVSIQRGLLAARQWSSGSVGSVRLLGAVFLDAKSTTLRRSLAGAVEILGGGFPRHWIAKRTRSGFALGPALAELAALADLVAPGEARDDVAGR